MRIEATIGICVALALGSWAYLDLESFRAERTSESHLWRGFDVAIAALVVVLVAGVSTYLFTQVPALLWEMTAALLLGSFSLRLFLRAG